MLSLLTASCGLATRILPPAAAPKVELDVSAGDASFLVADPLIGGASRRLRARQPAERKRVVATLRGLFDAAYLADAPSINELAQYLTSGAAKQSTSQMAEVTRPKLPVPIDTVQRASLDIDSIAIFYPLSKQPLAAAPVHFDGLFGLKDDGAVRIQVDGTCYLLRQGNRWLVYGFDLKRSVDTPDRKGRPSGKGRP